MEKQDVTSQLAGGTSGQPTSPLANQKITVQKVDTLVMGPMEGVTEHLPPAPSPGTSTGATPSSGTPTPGHTPPKLAGEMKPLNSSPWKQVLVGPNSGTKTVIVTHAGVGSLKPGAGIKIINLPAGLLPAGLNVSKVATNYKSIIIPRASLGQVILHRDAPTGASGETSPSAWDSGHPQASASSWKAGGGSSVVYHMAPISGVVRGTRTPEKGGCEASGSAPCTGYSRGVYENFRRWQQYKDLARKYFPMTPDTEAVSCFFIPVLRSLAQLKPQLSTAEGIPLALREWEKLSNFDRMIYYEMAEKFMEFELEELSQKGQVEVTSQLQPQPVVTTPPSQPPTPSAVTRVKAHSKEGYVPKKATRGSQQSRKLSKLTALARQNEDREIPPEAVNQYVEILHSLTGGESKLVPKPDEDFLAPDLLKYIEELCEKETFITMVEAVIHPEFVRNLLSPEKEDQEKLLEELEEEESLTLNELIKKRILAEPENQPETESNLSPQSKPFTIARQSLTPPPSTECECPYSNHLQNLAMQSVLDTGSTPEKTPSVLKTDTKFPSENPAKKQADQGSHSIITSEVCEPSSNTSSSALEKISQVVELKLETPEDSEQSPPNSDEQTDIKEEVEVQKHFLVPEACQVTINTSTGTSKNDMEMSLAENQPCKRMVNEKQSLHHSTDSTEDQTSIHIEEEKNKDKISLCLKFNEYKGVQDHKHAESKVEIHFDTSLNTSILTGGNSNEESLQKADSCDSEGTPEEPHVKAEDEPSIRRQSTTEPEEISTDPDEGLPLSIDVSWPDDDHQGQSQGDQTDGSEIQDQGKTNNLPNQESHWDNQNPNSKGERKVLINTTAENIEAPSSKEDFEVIASKSTSAEDLGLQSHQNINVSASDTQCEVIELIVGGPFSTGEPFSAGESGGDGDAPVSFSSEGIQPDDHVEQNKSYPYTVGTVESDVPGQSMLWPSQDCHGVISLKESSASLLDPQMTEVEHHAASAKASSSGLTDYCEDVAKLDTRTTQTALLNGLSPAESLGTGKTLSHLCSMILCEQARPLVVEHEVPGSSNDYPKVEAEGDIACVTLPFLLEASLGEHSERAPTTVPDSSVSHLEVLHGNEEAQLKSHKKSVVSAPSKLRKRTHRTLAGVSGAQPGAGVLTRQQKKDLQHMTKRQCKRQKR
ncbi:uncharacterized protein LOC102365960 [Latimeria chalumnae]|uniref:uncharacterized protein LOC102365960 n=1 Tax=Latimeria chalumnae TaxID=7897 RepID=UPI0006D907B7|nr:PREDICTED: NUT family member 1 [Latimeria chalumnae]XP_014352420.1 PREDICTED: NUT family member 1 [Latimeria chalumnae]XP_014352421.1 PREDICTED: NUT family member 1 [Latimeria chalumnae]|eukprot:XP_014352419.1 PREDICTED: NUT family member 1 [Latimeria chalumnae]